MGGRGIHRDSQHGETSVTTKAAANWQSFFFFQFSADVVACNKNPDTGIIEGLDTYNDPPKNRANTVDKHQNVVHFSGNFSDGRIKCRYSLRIKLTCCCVTACVHSC